MEGVREVGSVLDGDGVVVAGPQRLGGEQCHLLQCLLLQHPRLLRPDGRPGHVQTLAMQDNGAGLTGDGQVYGSCPREGLRGEVRVDEEVVVQWDDVLR